MSSGFERAERLNMKAHPELRESRIQALIAEDPSILGLGDLELLQRERMQPRAGRLDLLLRDPDTKRRYEVELQLGSTDETHIIRTIEYWDIERKRYPQYDHCAVLIAEDITSRFLNVVSLFNGVIPLIALQMQALRIGSSTAIVFTRVLDEMSLGVVDEEEEAQAQPADRPSWEANTSKSSLTIVDALALIAQELDSSIKLKYNKHYIGLEREGIPFNFVTFRPKRQFVKMELKLPATDDVDSAIETAGFDTLDYDARYGAYRLRLTASDVQKHEGVLRTLMSLAYARRVS